MQRDIQKCCLLLVSERNEKLHRRRLRACFPGPLPSDAGSLENGGLHGSNSSATTQGGSEWGPTSEGRALALRFPRPLPRVSWLVWFARKAEGSTSRKTGCPHTSPSSKYTVVGATTDPEAIPLRAERPRPQVGPVTQCCQNPGPEVGPVTWLPDEIRS